MSDSSLTPAIDASDDAALLQSLAASHGLELTTEQSELLARYGRVLWDWNAQLNLTRHTDWNLFVTRDLLDTVQLAAHVPQNAKVLDVGSGGGVPGLALAILRPDLNVTLCESVQKKATALQDMIATLNLPVRVRADRAEVVLKTEKFSVVTARAVGSISKMLAWFEPVWSSVGQLLLIKGPRWIDEQTEAQADGSLKRRTIEVAASWPTPGRDHESVLLRIG